ncbi:MAG: hypothetical protein AAGF23_27490, partial [Acidobacteriota bacterium]
GQQAWLAIWDLEPSRIRRADLLRLRGSSFFEDETLAMDVPGLEAALETEEEADGSPGADADAEGDGPQGWRGFFHRIFAGRG